MHPRDKADFVKLLNVCYSTALRPLPSFESIDLWLAMLQPYPLAQVRAALDAHMREHRQAPVPADVLARLEPNRDSRPQADEAWAIAFNARDERETVVWTDETARAWEIVRKLVDSDETGARFAFRSAYTRLVDQARANATPTRWRVSPGHDQQRRIEVVDAAVRAGHLSLSDARTAVPALPAPSADRDGPPSAAQMQARKRLREIVGGIVTVQQRRVADRQSTAVREAEATAARKREIDEQVRDYASAHGIRESEPGDDEVPA